MLGKQHQTEKPVYVRHNAARNTQAVLLITIMLLTSCTQAAFRVRCVRLAGVNHVLLHDVAGFYGMRCRNSRDNIRLWSRYSDLNFTIDRRQATVNGVLVHLSYAPDRWRGQAMVSEYDFRLLLDPLLRPAALKQRTVHRIVIDPGHGGRDPGAEAHRLQEKHLTLQIAQRVRRYLRSMGYSVRLTRYGDTYVPLSKRTALARETQADLFVSVHINAAGSPAVKGIETFFLTPEGTPSTYDTEATLLSNSGNTFDVENARLAFEIQKYSVAGTQSVGRGMKHATFAVLRSAPCPAVLTEAGFLTHREEARRLASAEHQERLARGIAYGILAYHKALQQR